MEHHIPFPRGSRARSNVRSIIVEPAGTPKAPCIWVSVHVLKERHSMCWRQSLHWPWLVHPCSGTLEKGRGTSVQRDRAATRSITPLAISIRSYTRPRSSTRVARRALFCHSRGGKAICSVSVALEGYQGHFLVCSKCWRSDWVHIKFHERLTNERAESPTSLVFQGRVERVCPAEAKLDYPSQ